MVGSFILGVLLAMPMGASPTVSEAADGDPAPFLDSPALPAGPATYTVEVSTEGTNKIGNLLWNNGQGGMETRDDRSAPFRTEVTVGPDRQWSTVQVTAQLPTDADSTASITCTIKNGVGTVLDTQTSRGLYAVASCNSAGI